MLRFNIFLNEPVPDSRYSKASLQSFRAIIRRIDGVGQTSINSYRQTNVDPVVKLR